MPGPVQGDVDLAIADVYRAEWGRLLSILIARTRRLDLAEDALSEAFARASERWPVVGVPANPAGWLYTTASRQVIGRLRSDAVAGRKAPLLAVRDDRPDSVEPREWGAFGDVDDIGDERLAVVLLCCHPALRPEARSALALRLAIGTPTTEIARLFLVSPTTMAARVTRAEKKIVTAGIPLAHPVGEELTARLDDVCRTIYLAFTAGYTPGDGPNLLRTDRAGGAIELAVVLRSLVPAAPQVQALADRLPESWELLPHAVVQYFIAPELIVSNLCGHVTTWRFVPGGPGTTEVMHTLYTRGEVVDPDERESYHRRFESARAVTGVEDYPESARVHGNLESGRVEHPLIGRNEAGVHLFHDAVERALER